MLDFLQILGAFLTTVTAAGGIFLGILKYFDKKREKTTQKQIEEAAKPIVEENKLQSAKLAEINNKVDRNERDRLRATIMEFADKLRNHFIVNKADFQHIHHMYDKYHDELHGNSYIENEYEFIKQKEQEFYNNNSHKGRDK